MNTGGAPLWLALESVPAQYPWAAEDIECGVCVVGGGITGVLCALRLAEQGEDVVLITAGQLASGSTAAAMPCVQYDSGFTLRQLTRKVGRDMAIAMLEMGSEALDELEELCSALDGDCGFARRDAFLFTDDDNELDMIGREFIERRRAGFDCSFITRSAARDVFAFDVSGGIMTKGQAAEVDPYRLAHLCAARAVLLGARIYENTEALRIDHDPKEGRSAIALSTYRTIRAKQVVVATGGACADMLDGMAAPRTLFTVLSRSQRRLTGWPGRCVIRSFSSPYVTFTATSDNRICAGGMPTAAVDENSRLYGVLPLPGLHNRRFRQLEAGAQYMFPNADTQGFEYARACRSYGSADGLPIVGAAPDCPDCWFAACSGTGSVLLSEAASRVIADLCAGRESRYAPLFTPERRSLR